MGFAEAQPILQTGYRLAELRASRIYLHTLASFSAKIPSTPLINPTIA